MGLPKDILEDWVLSNIKKFDKKLVGDPVNGTRKISGQLFSPPDTIMATSTTSSSAEVASMHPDLEVPLNLYSIQAFEFIGFTTKTSERLLQAWITGDNFNHNLLDTIVAHISEYCDNAPTDWEVSMNKLGISEQVQNKIMDPGFTDVRCTASLMFWILQLVHENLWTLENMSERLNRNLNIIQSGQKEVPSLRRGAPENRSKYVLTRAGHTTLYRSTSAARLEKTFKSRTLRLDQMSLGPIYPGDFNLEKRGYYWSNQHWVAERFAAYTSNIIKAQDNVCVIRALIPSGLLEGKGVWKLSFGNDWRKLVWYSRNQETYPPDIQERFEQSSLIIGPVSINHNDVFKSMKSWKDVSESNTWQVGGETGMQYVWVGMQSMAGMNKYLEEKWDLFKGQWMRCREDPWADCKAKWIPEPVKWVEEHLA